MSEPLSLGDVAPDFDLTSTEDVVLMLRDEVPRMAVLLYFFADPGGDRERRDLGALASAQQALKRRRTVILGVSPAKLEDLKQLQRELALGFPLLQDDRDFTARYGVAGSEEAPPQPALFVVDKDQKVVWQARPVASVEAALAELDNLLRRQPRQTYHYPSQVVNRVVDWWINKIRGARVA